LLGEKAIMTRPSAGAETFPPAVAFLPALLAGGLLLAAGVVGGRTVWAGLPLLAPLACLGHALTFCALVCLFGEARRLRRCRLDLGRFPSRERLTWADRAWESIRRDLAPTRNPTLKDYELRGEDYGRGWARELDLRMWGYFGLALAPFILGGLLTLPGLLDSRSPLRPAAELFQPLTIGTVEALLVGLQAFILFLGWNRLFNDFLAALPGAVRKGGPTLTEREDDLARREADVWQREEAVLRRERALPETDMSDLVRDQTFNTGEE